jgi:hypothetical protein
MLVVWMRADRMDKKIGRLGRQQAINAKRAFWGSFCIVFIQFVRAPLLLFD